MTEGNEQPPTKIPPILFDETQPLVQAIQQKTRGALLCYWNSPTGNISQSDVQAFYEVLEQIEPQKTLYLFLKSLGGDGTASLRIVNLLHRYAERVVVLVPHVYRRFYFRGIGGGDASLPDYLLH